ncbi:MAG: ATP-binding protein [Lachnospiraceae bacterium]|nr:ATP-binding protein [Lachnospiraceae bacterium]
MIKKRPPVGIEDFSKLVSQDFYYVDKTGLIRELLENWGEVNLFTRPRRFGKSLNMSMLRAFFEIGTDASLFEGLEISRETALCEKYLGEYPVISLSLKDVAGNNYEEARRQMQNIVRREADRLAFLQNSEVLDDIEKTRLHELRTQTGDPESSLLLLSDLLYKHYGKKVIILIDEYDVPLQKAETKGYFDQMVSLISRFFSYGMKTNNNMLFAVVTGCFRIVKESIFTGFNNPKVHSITDKQYDEWFGFTDAEVQQMLDYYNLSEYYDLTREWYDGYLFGAIHVYCPWDVVNWCEQLRRSRDARPQNFWANSSSNDMVLRFVERADETTKAEMEELSEGKSIDKYIRTDLTYAELDRSIDHLWSVLFTTGYLTHCGQNEDGTYRLVIPNREIRTLFDQQIREWFFTQIEDGLQPLFHAFDQNCPEEIEQRLNACLAESIGFMDGGNTEEMRESFYHGLLLGMLRGRRSWLVKSNREAGEGRADILLVDRTHQLGHIIEVKYASDYRSLEKKAQEGLRQIEDTRYDEYFLDYDIQNICHYGISFHRKKCRVVTPQPISSI